MQEIDTVFDYIPDETNNSVIYTKFFCIKKVCVFAGTHTTKLMK